MRRDLDRPGAPVDRAEGELEEGTGGVVGCRGSAARVPRMGGDAVKPVPNSPGPLVGGIAALAGAVAQFAVERRVRGSVALLAGVVGVLIAFALRLVPSRWTGRGWWMAVGRPRSGWIGYAPVPENRGRRSPAETSPRRELTGPPPSLRDLTRVVAVGQVQPTEMGTLTLLSLEAFRDGFLVRLLAAWAEAERPDAEGLDLVERVVVEAIDDRGRRYEPWFYGGGGNGASWRFDHACSPALDPLAQELRLTIPALAWRRAAPPWLPATDEPWTETGPWTFVVPLDGASGATDAVRS